MYYGEKQVIEKFKKEKNQAKGVFENHPLDAEVRMDQTVTTQSKSLPSLNVEEKGDHRDVLEERVDFKENIKSEQCDPSYSK